VQEIFREDSPEAKDLDEVMQHTLQHTATHWNSLQHAATQEPEICEEDSPEAKDLD